MRKIIALLLLDLATIALAQEAPISEAEWREAERSIQRLPPSAFKSLPTEIRTELEKRGCRVPQLYGDRPPHNAVQGHFIGTVRLDWAVLCSRKGTSAILVFQSEPPAKVWRIAPKPDFDFLQTIGQRKIGFSRQLQVASPARIRTYFVYTAEKAPPPLSHDGIDDVFEDKASTVHYFARGTWHHWLGSD